MRVDSSFNSTLMPVVDSVADIHNQPDPAAGDLDDLSECSDLDAQLNLSVQIQMAAMLSFAYIWSLGAFIPFRYTTFAYYYYVTVYPPIFIIFMLQ